jgi:hypothetical protein
MPARGPGGARASAAPSPAAEKCAGRYMSFSGHQLSWSMPLSTPLNLWRCCDRIAWGAAARRRRRAGGVSPGGVSPARAGSLLFAKRRGSGGSGPHLRALAKLRREDLPGVGGADGGGAVAEHDRAAQQAAVMSSRREAWPRVVEHVPGLGHAVGVEARLGQQLRRHPALERLAVG